MGGKGPFRDPETLTVRWIILDRSMVLRLAELHKPDFKESGTTPLGLPYKVLVAGERELDWAIGHCLKRLTEAGIPFLEIKLVLRPSLKSGLIPDPAGPVAVIIYYRHYHEVHIE